MEKQDNPINNENSQNNPPPYESDTEKLMHLHLRDENHQITDEEMKSIKISTEHTEAEIQNLEEEQGLTNEDEPGTSTDLDEKIVTPWDVTT